ncbi:MAG: sulfatase-like hydrolase/transferase [Thermoproteota archaeon]
MNHETPNFLIIITDQQRSDCLGCYGNDVIRTPNIDRMAKEGVQFTRTYVNNPLCMPSRATLFTGKTPRGHHVRTNGIPLEWKETTLPAILGALGYITHAVGKIHLRPFDIPLGSKLEELEPKEFPESREFWLAKKFQKFPEPYYGLQSVDFIGGHGDYTYGDYLVWLEKNYPGKEKLLKKEFAVRPPSGAQQSWKSSIPEELHPSTWIADRTIEFLEKVATEDRPFFLWCSFPDPHHPFCPPEPWCDMYDPEEVPSPKMMGEAKELDNMPPHFKLTHEKGLLTSGTETSKPTKMSKEEISEIRAHTYGMISLIDKNVGKILNTVKRLNLDNRTVVVFLSDHGELLGDHGLCFKGPFHYEGLVRVPFIWRWSNHFPSGLVVDSLVSLLDFFPTILDIAGVKIPEGFVPPNPYDPWLSWPPVPGKSLVPLLKGDKNELHDSVLIENDEDYLGLRLRTLVTKRYKITIYQGKNYGELFDLQNDPDEYDNLWYSHSHQMLREELSRKLLHKIVETDDSLPRRLCHA